MSEPRGAAQRPGGERGSERYDRASGSPVRPRAGGAWRPARRTRRPPTPALSLLPRPNGPRFLPPAPAIALTIDALGRKCPIPIIMLAEQIRDVPLGAVVAVLADDPAAYTDIPSWCMMKAHEFAGYQELPRGGWALYIRRRL